MRLKFIFVIIIVVNLSYLSAQERFYTKGTYNGHAWNNMYINSKLNFLTSLLDRWRFPEKPGVSVSDTNCTRILKQISDGEIHINVSLRDMVGYLNSFYYDQENLDVPIVSSYCTIVKNIEMFEVPYTVETTDSLRTLFSKKKSEK